MLSCFASAPGVKANLKPRGEGRERKCNEANVERYRGGNELNSRLTQTVRFTHSVYSHRGLMYERGRQSGWDRERDIKGGGKKKRNTSLGHK